MLSAAQRGFIRARMYHSLVDVDEPRFIKVAEARGSAGTPSTRAHPRRAERSASRPTPVRRTLRSARPGTSSRRRSAVAARRRRGRGRGGTRWCGASRCSGRRGHPGCLPVVVLLSDLSPAGDSPGTLPLGARCRRPDPRAIQAGTTHFSCPGSDSDATQVGVAVVLAENRADMAQQPRDRPFRRGRGRAGSDSFATLRR